MTPRAARGITTGAAHLIRAPRLGERLRQLRERIVARRLAGFERQLLAGVVEIVCHRGSFRRARNKLVTR